LASSCGNPPAKKGRLQAPPHEDEDIAACAAGPKLPTRTHHAALAITARIETAVMGATPALGLAGDVRGLPLVLAEMAGVGGGGGDRLLCFQLARYVNASSARFEPLLKGSNVQREKEHNGDRQGPDAAS
jgi:hypothetical protein